MMVSKQNKAGTKFISIGGINEDRIGGNSSVIVYTNQKGDVVRIMNDLGSMFTPYESNFSVAVPNADDYFDKEDENGKIIEARKPVSALFLTHVHEDHAGALIHYQRMGYKLPQIYASRFTRNLLRSCFAKAGLKPPVIERIDAGKVIEFNDDFKVEAFRVSHSVVDSLGFCMTGYVNGEPQSAIINHGDFLIEDDMPVGKSFSMSDYEEIIRNNGAKTMISFVDSTSISTDDDLSKTKRIGFEKAVENVLGVVALNPERKILISPVISRSVQNIAIDLEAARKLGTRVCLDGQWLKLVVEALQMSDYKEFDDVVYKGSMAQYLAEPKIEKKYIVCTGAFAQGLEEYEKNRGEVNNIAMSSAVRMALNLHNDIKIDNNVLVLARQRIIDEINGETGPKMYQMLARQGAKVVLSGSRRIANFEQVQMQDSGHINRERFEEFLRNIKNIRNDIVYVPHHGNMEQCRGVAEIVNKNGSKTYLTENMEEILIDANGVYEDRSNYQPPFRWIAGKEVFRNPLREDYSIPVQGKWEYWLVDEHYQPIEKVAEVDNPTRYGHKDNGYHKNYENFENDPNREPMSRKDKKRVAKNERKNRKKGKPFDRNKHGGMFDDRY